MTATFRTAFRRLRMGLVTLLVPHRPLGFFTPYRFAAAAQRRAKELSYPCLETLFHERRERFLGLLELAGAFETEFEAIGAEPSPAPRWDQNWFTGLDAIAAYTLVREQKPARIVEVGAGHSTRFFARAIQDAGIETTLTVIDPEPRTSISGLDIRHRQCLVTEAPETLWTSLEPGDFVSLDSSHILMPGTDVDFILNDVLPFLPVGVFVHFHDIFLPDAYPQDWQWRGYNEQSAVAMLLTTGAYAPVFASHYVATRRAAKVHNSPCAMFANHAGARPSSLWLRKANCDRV